MSKQKSNGSETEITVCNVKRVADQIGRERQKRIEWKSWLPQWALNAIFGIGSQSEQEGIVVVDHDDILIAEIWHRGGE